MFPVLILLITCTNVSALLAGLGVARRREIAVRLALGAGRRRIVRQLVTETVMLAMAAGALGLFVIWLLLRLFDASIPDLAIEIDWRSIAFTFSLALVAGVLFGFSPALHATRLALQEALKDSAGVVVARRLRLQSWLVVAQIAFTQPALLAMGALLLEMRSDLRELPAQPYADRLLEVRFNVNPRYGPLDDDREQTLVRLQERLAAVPGVEGVVRQENDDSFDVEVHPADTVAGLELASPQQVRGIAAPAGYFPLMGISFVRGRDFDAAERSPSAASAGIDEGAIVIGSGLARRLWGGADPIGRRLVSVGRNLRGIRTFTIVGVVDDATTGARRTAEDILNCRALEAVGAHLHAAGAHDQSPSRPHARSGRTRCCPRFAPRRSTKHRRCRSCPRERSRPSKRRSGGPCSPPSPPPAGPARSRSCSRPSASTPWSRSRSGSGSVRSAFARRLVPRAVRSSDCSCGAVCASVSSAWSSASRSGSVAGA